ncbi:MAG: DNA mismatch repair protein MutS [Candidatus Wallbacteria bacterium HGW-Wallbacteria-1]|jgi:DNA mismatch repair protein MutS|uniref:DNA mismatch repair protein MutS n=1 Tax=Candidatus Wallbacteria bacterium HGW-Wallbacteria-1 TaxID=2013854 RepID=A0A2N1PSF0_9BACT|nr:MAG: DNA mismatch repair protein MutS [Candidatus Wallbacteria bacterium HGW-Wallbacteria-1]
MPSEVHITPLPESIPDTPMMRQYMAIKSDYQDSILFYRLGDFYEMFFEDARIAARELELTLTSRNKSEGEPIPLAGVPYHSAESYISRLVSRGYKVVICEQVEDPRQAKGLVRREVVRIVTPGTSLLTDTMVRPENNFLMTVFMDSRSRGAGISYADITTGEFYATEFSGAGASVDVLAELIRIKPSEVILSEACRGTQLHTVARDTLNASVRIQDFSDTHEAREILQDFLGVLSLAGYDLKGRDHACQAAAAILQILDSHRLADSHVLDRITYYEPGDSMHLDAATIMNLEILETLSDKQKRGSLLWIMDRTKTAMGARMLRSWLVKPMARRDDILRRQSMVDALTRDFASREDLGIELDKVYDMERILSKASFGSVNPRDMLQLRASLSAIPEIRRILTGSHLELKSSFAPILDVMGDFSELEECIGKTIREDAPVTVREGGMILHGCSHELDELKSIASGGREFLANYEFSEREKSGIKSLKVRYNRVFGYYIEITRSNLDSVPEHYIRKQTLANCERYYTEELKEKESLILGADDKINILEYELFRGIVETVISRASDLRQAARALAELDSLCSMAVVAVDNGWVMPQIFQDGCLRVRDGRHPVVEKMLECGDFVPNDIDLDLEGRQIMIITGPNMAGKSTYIRQTALITLLAHVGSFVPAAEARIDLVDRIFTRVGASDNLASGLSTFMVEMLETANILNSATSRSLVILDEIGRGTSTFDGISIAWAVTEFLHSQATIGAKTMFATHYHELTEMEKLLPRVKNYNVAVTEGADKVTFLRKIIPGGTDKSYGIEVARMAGLPQSVIDRAKEILLDLEEANTLDMGGAVAGKVAGIGDDPQFFQSCVEGIDSESDSLRIDSFVADASGAGEYDSCEYGIAGSAVSEIAVSQGQLHLFETAMPVLEELLNMDLMKTSPIQALNFLFFLQRKVMGEDVPPPFPPRKGRSRTKFRENLTELMNLKLFQ